MVHRTLASAQGADPNPGQTAGRRSESFPRHLLDRFADLVPLEDRGLAVPVFPGPSDHGLHLKDDPRLQVRQDPRLHAARASEASVEPYRDDPGPPHTVSVDNAAMPNVPKPKPSVIEQSIEIDCPVEKLFRFHCDTRNAPRVSPGVEFESIDGTFPLRDGGIVTIVMRQKPIPFRMTWRFRVEAVVLNRAIVDVAVKSPFAAWRHEHRFEPLGHDRCRLTDRITYRPPFGPMGAIGDRLIVNRMLRKTFEQRQVLTKRLMEQ